MKVREVLGHGARVLRERGVENPQLDSAVLLACAMDLSRDAVYIAAGREVPPDRLSLYGKMISRRCRREPIQYITGTREFMSLELAVRPGVLVPRPETEILVEVAVELALDALASRRSGNRGDQGSFCAGPGNVGRGGQYIMADIGTGSGAMAIALARLIGPRAGDGGLLVFATDISDEALAIARENVNSYGLGEQVLLVQGDLWAPLAGRGLESGIDAVVSNPPYIRHDEMATLPDEVGLYEPGVALDGGVDGLYFYRRIVVEAWRFLRSGGFLALEVGSGQALHVMSLMAASGLARCATRRDLAGIERVVFGFRE